MTSAERNASSVAVAASPVTATPSWTALLVAMVCGSLVSCGGGSSAATSPVTSDPMATYLPASAKETFRDVTKGGGTSPLGKPRHARLVRTVLLGSSADASASLADAVAAAEQTGWSATSTVTAGSGGATWTGEKVTAGSSLSLGLSLRTVVVPASINVVIFDNS